MTAQAEGLVLHLLDLAVLLSSWDMALNQEQASPLWPYIAAFPSLDVASSAIQFI